MREINEEFDLLTRSPRVFVKLENDYRVIRRPRGVINSFSFENSIYVFFSNREQSFVLLEYFTTNNCVHKTTFAFPRTK